MEKVEGGNAAHVLRKIRECAAAGRFAVVQHAWQRMKERNVQYTDLHHALVHAVRCTVQENGRWKVQGRGIDGDLLQVIVLIEDGFLVITVF